MSTWSPDAVETLAAVIDTGSFDAAARHLRITPSAVSQRIRALEERVGRTLVVRTQPARATPHAAPLLSYARQLAVLDHDVTMALGGAAASKDLPLAVTADALATWLLAPLARLHTDHGLMFDLHRDDQEFTAALLESGQVLAAVSAQSTPVAGCSVSRLGVMRYRAVASPDFVARWGRDQEHLARAPYVDFDNKDDLQRRWLEVRGVDSIPPRHRVPSSGEFAVAITLGMGWGMLPEQQIGDAVEQGRLVDLEGPRLDVPLYWQQWTIRSRILDVVAAEIAAEAHRVLSPLDSP